eukprot:5921704-Alexandrium_andersonii.AAC.1
MGVSFEIPILGANFDRARAAKGETDKRRRYKGEEQTTLAHAAGFESLYAILCSMEIKPQAGDDAV